MEDILKRLDANEIELLRRNIVRFKIPDEFRRDDAISHLTSTILSPAPDELGHTLIRYRADLISTTASNENHSKHLESALRKLDRLLDINNASERVIKSTLLEKNQLLLIDNGRWLHGRTQILDLERHLIRIRFQDKKQEMLPWTIF